MANGEWELLTAIVTANNQRDYAALYRILADDNVVFSDKPRCVQAAVSAIELVPEQVKHHREILLNFVNKIDGVQTDMRTEIRLEILKGLLAA